MTVDIIENKHRSAVILLVEDNPGDVLLTKRAFKNAQVVNQLEVASSGEQALEMLNNEGEYAKLQKPDLILLDLNLPQMSGRDVLKVVKESDHLRHIPVIVLSSSSAERDVVKSYNLHANGYIVKPVDVGNFSEAVKKIEAFWFSLVVLPDANDAKKVV